MASIQYLRLFAGLLLSGVALALIGVSARKFFDGKRSTFSHEETLGNSVLFPNVGVCMAVEKVLVDGKFVKRREIIDGFPIVGEVTHGVFKNKELGISSTILPNHRKRFYFEIRDILISRESQTINPLKFQSLYCYTYRPTKNSTLGRKGWVNYTMINILKK